MSLAFYSVNGNYCVYEIIIIHTCLMTGVLKDDIGSVGCRASKVNSLIVVFSITKEGCWSDFDNFTWLSRWYVTYAGHSPSPLSQMG